MSQSSSNKRQPDIFFMEKVKEQPTTKSLELLENSPVGYFEYIITGFNFILLIPFRLRRSPKNVITCEKNIFHQVLSGILLLCALTWTICDFITVININLYEQPVKLFAVVIYFVSLFYAIVFYNIFWRTTDEIENFAKLSSSNYLCQSKLFYAILTFYPLLLDVLLGYQFLNIIPIPSAQENWYISVFKVIKAVGYFIDTILYNFVDALTAALAICGYDMIRKNIAALEDLRNLDIAEKQWKAGDFSCLIDIAQRLQTFFVSLNKIGSSVILAWFCMLVPWVSQKLVDSLPGTGRGFRGGESGFMPWAVVLYYWAFFGLYIVILVLCAEIKRECYNIKYTMKKVIFQYDPKLISGRAALTHIEDALENVGIHGGFFFKFSYSFIGSAAGLVVAYAFLSLQLQVNCCSSSTTKITEPLTA